MRYLLLAAAVAGALAVPNAAHATTDATTDEGWITGVVDTSELARQLPCAPRDVVGDWADEGVGVACFPKRSSTWWIDQIDECTLRSDVTSGFRMVGTCVLGIDMGDYVKVWAPPEAVDEDFAIVWG